jgi:hypothetical protein
MNKVHNSNIGNERNSDHKTLARLLGCHLSVIVLDELLLQETKHADETGWFCFQVEKLQQVCMIGRHSRRKCFEILESFKILRIEKRGIPCRYFYKIDSDMIDKLRKTISK